MHLSVLGLQAPLRRLKIAHPGLPHTLEPHQRLPLCALDPERDIDASV